LRAVALTRGLASVGECTTDFTVATAALDVTRSAVDTSDVAVSACTAQIACGVFGALKVTATLRAGECAIASFYALAIGTRADFIVAGRQRDARRENKKSDTEKTCEVFYKIRH